MKYFIAFTLFIFISTNLYAESQTDQLTYKKLYQLGHIDDQQFKKYQSKFKSAAERMEFKAQVRGVASTIQSSLKTKKLKNSPIEISVK